MKYFAYSQKEFIYKYIVMMSDVDQFKHMSFANYLKLMFLASDALFSECISKIFLEKCHMKVESSRMQFKRQTVPGESILVKVNSTEIEKNRFTLIYTFILETGGELVALGKQVHGFLNLNTETTSNDLPNYIKEILNPIKVEVDGLIYKY